MSYPEMSRYMASNGFSCAEHIKNQLLVCSQPSKERDELSAIVSVISLFFTVDILASGQKKIINEIATDLSPEIAKIPDLLSRTKIVVRHSFNNEDSITFSCAALSACSYEPVELIDALTQNQIISANSLKLFTPNLFRDFIPLMRQNFGQPKKRESKEQKAVAALLDRMTDNVKPRDGSAMCAESENLEELCVFEGSIDYTFPSSIVADLSPDALSRLGSLGSSLSLNAIILRKRSPIGLK